MVNRILGDDGFARPFVVHSPLADVDIADARIESGPFTLPPPLARARLKQWQHYCILSPEVLVTTAVVDAAYLRLSWIQVVDLATGERHEHHRQLPLASCRVARSLWNDRTWYRSRGYAAEFHSHLDERRHVVSVRADGGAGAPAVDGTWTIDHDPASVESMVVSLPLGRRRCAYSHKVALPAAGTLTLGERSWSFDPESAIAILDIHKAHYPREMFWRWATFAGHDEQGRLVAMNLTRNVVEDDVSWNENAVWVDGRVHRIGPAVFDFDPSDLDRSWRLGSADDAVNLSFEPVGGRGENLDIPGVARSRFEQKYGRFHGVVRAGTELLTIDGMWGLCEDHTSVW